MKRLVLPALLLLVGCVSVVNRSNPVRNEAGREEYLATHTDWAFTGRLAYAHAGKGGSARISWRQSAEISEVRVMGPLAMGSAYLRVDANQAQILDAGGQPVKSGTPEALLAELLQVPGPLPALPQGLRAFWPEKPEWNAFASAGSVRIAEWSWHYGEWRDEPVRLPGVIVIERGQTRLRLVIDQWQELPND
ncbi:MAG: outer membrane lipoprotein LolB [Arenimonas sp.]|uniref:outer membrane lipoprotein LolB n=1 Tax=Arenimonas sp. TaxID=1872635 RepID=UPI001B41FFB6|nr:outer membrane lipoprotein LolB [Arenimonas sp.]